MDQIVAKQLLQITVREDNDRIKRLVQLMQDAGIIKFDDHQQQSILDCQSLSDHNVAQSNDSAILCKDTSLLLETEIHHEDKMTTILHMVTAHINEKTKYNKTLLHLSAEIGDQELVSIFLKTGADVNAKDVFSDTPLHLSARNGHKEVVEILLKAGADVNAKDVFSGTPLHLSARNGHKEVVEILLKAGATVDAKDHINKTSLHFSAFKGHIEIVDMLLKAGVNVDAKDNDNKTPLHLSSRRGHKEIVEMLLIAGANVDAKDNYYNTPLHLSAEFGHKEIVENLLKYGATVDVMNNFGYIPLNLSAKYGHTEIVEILQKLTQLLEKNELDTHPGLKHLHASQRVDAAFKSSGMNEIQNWIYGATNNTTSVRSPTSSMTTMEYSSTKFPSLESLILISEASDSNNDCDDAERESLESLTSETADIEPDLSHSGSVSSAASSFSARSHNLSDTELSELSNVRQQVQDHWAQFSPKLKGGWQTTCTADVKTVIQDRQIIMPTTINIKKKIVTNINHANVVSHNGTVSIYHRKESITDDDDDSYDDSNVNEDP